jgi:hypothetical protein
VFGTTTSILNGVVDAKILDDPEIQVWTLTIYLKPICKHPVTNYSSKWCCLAPMPILIQKARLIKEIIKVCI